VRRRVSFLLLGRQDGERERERTKGPGGLGRFIGARMPVREGNGVF
jgi:hypothetical protein